MKIGDQILYDPGHESGRECGFITGVKSTGETIFCRFWSRHNLGFLRTLANSEGCRKEDLVKTGENVPQQIVKAWLKYLGYL